MTKTEPAVLRVDPSSSSSFPLTYCGILLPPEHKKTRKKMVVMVGKRRKRKDI